MKIINPSVELINPVEYEVALNTIELAGRTCYKSENKMTEGSAEEFIRNIIKRGHEAVLEHVSITVKFICDRGVSHEIVRHRIASYCQESTRYCNYSKDKFGNEITIIRPNFFDGVSKKYACFVRSCKQAETDYFDLLNEGARPEQARSVLPNSLKTELVMTTNIREWRHFFKLRCSKAAHPQMRQVAIMLFEQMKDKYPVFFEDIDIDRL